MSQSVRTILVDDEKNCLAALEQLIGRYCYDLEVIERAANVKEAVQVIDLNKPDLVFLDIRMPDGSGFNVLDKVGFKNFEVIFTTAYEEYAIKAFEFSAIHYLLKPIDKNTLIDAVERYLSFHSKAMALDKKLDVLKENFQNNHQRIMLPSSEGFSIYQVDDIIRCEASGCYTTFYITSESKPVLVSNPIGTYEKLLGDLNFYRIHSKHLVNLRYISRFMKSYGGYVVMQDGSEVKVSERRKSYLMEKLREQTRL